MCSKLTFLLAFFLLVLVDMRASAADELSEEEGCGGVCTSGDDEMSVVMSIPGRQLVVMPLGAARWY